MPALIVERQLEIVTQQLVRAKISHDIWWLYKGSETRPAIIETLNEFSEFFRFDEHAHFVSMVIHCAVVWDNVSGTVSQPTVSKQILDPRRFPADQTLTDDIAGRAKEAGGLVKLRHEAIAHRSVQFDYSAAFRRAGLVPNSVAGMLEAWLQLINRLRIRKSLSEVIFAEIPLQHLQQLIHSLGGPNLTPESPLDELFRR